MGPAGLHAFHQMGVKKPAVFSVISYDDHYSFKLHSPTITIVEQPINDIAVKAVELLMQQMVNENDFVVEKVLQKGKLVIRESV